MADADEKHDSILSQLWGYAHALEDAVKRTFRSDAENDAALELKEVPSEHELNKSHVALLQKLSVHREQLLGAMEQRRVMYSEILQSVGEAHGELQETHQRKNAELDAQRSVPLDSTADISEYIASHFSLEEVREVLQLTEKLSRESERLSKLTSSWAQLRQLASTSAEQQEAAKLHKVGLFFALMKNALSMSLLAHQSITSGTVERRPSLVEEVLVHGIPVIGGLLSLAPIPFVGTAGAIAGKAALAADLVYDEAMAHKSEWVVEIYDPKKSADGCVLLDDLQRFATLVSQLVTSKFQYQIGVLGVHSIVKFAKCCVHAVIEHALSRKHQETLKTYRKLAGDGSGDDYVEDNAIVAVVLVSHTPASVKGELTEKKDKTKLTAVTARGTVHLTDTAIRRHTDMAFEDGSVQIGSVHREHQPAVGCRLVCDKSRALELHEHAVKQSNVPKDAVLAVNSPPLKALPAALLQSYAPDRAGGLSRFMETVESAIAKVEDVVLEHL